MVCTHVKIVNTTYANNCGTPTPLSKIDDACDGKAACVYNFSWFYDPGFDPAPGCPKDLNVDYLCLDDGQNVIASKSSYSPPEAVQAKLECGCE